VEKGGQVKKPRRALQRNPHFRNEERKREIKRIRFQKKKREAVEKGERRKGEIEPEIF
jgi:hypothetical protein